MEIRLKGKKHQYVNACISSLEQLWELDVPQKIDQAKIRSGQNKQVQSKVKSSHTSQDQGQKSD